MCWSMRSTTTPRPGFATVRPPLGDSVLLLFKGVLPPPPSRGLLLPAQASARRASSDGPAASVVDCWLRYWVVHYSGRAGHEGVCDRRSNSDEHGAYRGERWSEPVLSYDLCAECMRASKVDVLVPAPLLPAGDVDTTPPAIAQQVAAGAANQPEPAMAKVIATSTAKFFTKISVAALQKLSSEV